MALQTTVERVAARVPVTVMALDGELDASNFERLIEDVRGLYAAGDRTLLLDLSGLTFMASSGLVALHAIVLVMHGQRPPDLEGGWSAFHALTDAVEGSERQTEVQLCGAQAPVTRVLERTGLDRLFVSHPDRASAIAAI
ncbi:MAG TPA: STAS domain-containing protein [Candidatus Limnocylindrales bacterium]|jgi:anti-anti-sigma factor|nr:STAS domain-containing protein [Candidatus Limnocylindrales bacterium]